MKIRNSILYKLYNSVKVISKHFLFRFKPFEKWYFNNTINDEWVERIEVTLSSPDLKKFNCSKDSGEIKNGSLVLHNGIKVHPLSYYNKNYYNLMKRTKGVHEPQEELIFEEIIKKIPTGGVMVELGSYWAFYSIWFNKVVKNARNFMIEPIYTQMFYGKYNFKLNKCRGKFYQSYVGAKTEKKEGNKTICIDDFLDLNDLSHVNILHSDIQGYEQDMLKGAKKTLKNSVVDFFFISTHSNEIHNKCIGILKSYNYEILYSANLDESYSVDGLVVAKRADITLENDIIRKINSIEKISKL